MIGIFALLTRCHRKTQKGVFISVKLMTQTFPITHEGYLIWYKSVRIASTFDSTNYIRVKIYLSFYVVLHCLKCVHIRSYSGPYSVQVRENTDQNNSEYGHFSRSTEHFVAIASSLVSFELKTYNEIFNWKIGYQVYISRKKLPITMKERLANLSWHIYCHFTVILF